MTFRTKLLQAILAVVAASTAASLFVAQRQSSESYGALVDELFRNQATAFEREHETRLEVAAGEIERLAMSVRLFAALEENDPEVYKVAGDELRLGEFAFFRLLDAHGNVIPPPSDGRAGVFDPANVRGALRPSSPVVIVINDRRELYPEILVRAGLAIETRYRRHVNRRTGRRAGEFFEDVIVAR